MKISYFPNLHYWLPLLENLGTVKLSCLKHCQRLFLDIIQQKFHDLEKQIQHLIDISFFMIIVAVFFSSVFCSVFVTDCCYLFCCFYSYKTFCKSSNTCGSSTHFANIWHADKTEVVNVPFEKKRLLSDVFNLLYLKI